MHNLHIIDHQMHLSRFYPGVPDALKFASSRLYIVTTKQVWPPLLAVKEALLALEQFQCLIYLPQIAPPICQYIINAQFANFILRNYICFFLCHLPPSCLFSEPICRCFTPGACRSNNTTRKNIWSWHWVSMHITSILRKLFLFLYNKHKIDLLF